MNNLEQANIRDEARIFSNIPRNHYETILKVVPTEDLLKEIQRRQVLTEETIRSMFSVLGRMS